ncbi:MAG: M14 family metallopeptidase [Balneolales bacterium]
MSLTSHKTAASKLLAAIISLQFLIACATTDPSIIDYDPPGATTQTQAINPQYKRIIGAGKNRVWVSNEFDGARLSDFYQVDDTTYTALIKPEAAPINRSAWYSFKIWSANPTRIYLNLQYEDGTHRYLPKLSVDGKNWASMDSTLIQRDSIGTGATLKLNVSPDPLWISAQELITSQTLYDWMGNLSLHPDVDTLKIGHSKLGRPFYKLTISDAPSDAGMIIVTGRQHPPEIPGTIAMMTFIETLTADTELARLFRSHYQVIAFPLMNPDGVDAGHWRHSAAGVDLNRDWIEFNQPETKLVRDDLVAKAEKTGARVYFALDFHSTSTDIFYTINHDIETYPAGLSNRWLRGIRARQPDYVINEEPFGVEQPIIKNWIYHTFGSSGVTYEVGDYTDRQVIHDVAKAAAESLMEELIQYQESYSTVILD